MASNVLMIKSGASFETALFTGQGGQGLPRLRLGIGSRARSGQTAPTTHLTTGVKVPMTDCVSINGRITIDSSDETRRKLGMILHSKPTQLTVDLSGATFMDTSAVATLLEAVRIARRQGTRLVLSGLQGQPGHLLKVGLLHQLFEIIE